MTEPIFPVLPGQSWPTTKTPHFATRTQRGTSGRELRLADQPYPIWEFTLPFGLLRDDNDSRGAGIGAGFNELRMLMGFVLSVQGSFQTFLYDDPTDDTVSTEQQFGTGDGTTTTFQLGRTLISGGFFEPIVAPNTVTGIWIAGVLQSPSNYTVSATTGIVTFTTAPANGAAITWTGTFYFRCRFSEDSAEFSNLALGGWETKSLKFRSLLA